MFDLNKAIHQWRQNLLQRESVLRDDAAELEAHLRASVEAFRAHGLTEEEAFWIAVRRLGDPGSLAAEFGKVNGGSLWAGRLLWMGTGYLAITMVLGGMRILSTGAVLLGAQAGLNARVNALLFGLSMVLLGWSTVSLAIKAVRAQRFETMDRGLHWLQMVNRRGGRHWTGLTLVVLTVWLLSSVSGPALQWLYVRQTTAEAFGVFCYYTAWFNLVWSLLLPVALCGLVYWLVQRRQPGDSESSPASP